MANKQYLYITNNGNSIFIEAAVAKGAGDHVIPQVKAVGVENATPFSINFATMKKAERLFAASEIEELDVATTQAMLDELFPDE